VARLRAFVLMLYFWINSWRLLCGVSAGKRRIEKITRLPEGVAGLTEYTSATGSFKLFLAFGQLNWQLH
jgi:hypothetical protein